MFDITEFAVHDGPGIRTTVFLKGCPLRCAWCHNPEGQLMEPEEISSNSGKRMCGKVWESGELAEHLNKQASVLKPSGGGVTFSGGEPLMQPDFVVDVISKLDGIHTVLQTSGYAQTEVFAKVVSACDMVYFDLKLMDSEAHCKYIGVDNALILNNIHLLDTMEVPYVVRVPLVPGITDTAENLTAIAETAAGLHGLVRVDLLPYNKAAGGKYSSCNKIFTPDWDETLPCNADTSIFTRLGVDVRVS